MLVAFFVGAAPGTTTATALSFSYDVSAIPRVDVQPFGYAEANATLLSVEPEVSASRPASARGASRTPVVASVATNTAGSTIDDLLRPGGSLIGNAGTDETIRELTGGLTDARAMFQQLSPGGTVVEQTTIMITRVQLADGRIVSCKL